MADAKAMSLFGDIDFIMIDQKITPSPVPRQSLGIKRHVYVLSPCWPVSGLTKTTLSAFPDTYSRYPVAFVDKGKRGEPFVRLTVAGAAQADRCQGPSTEVQRPEKAPASR